MFSSVTELSVDSLSGVLLESLSLSVELLESLSLSEVLLLDSLSVVLLLESLSVVLLSEELSVSVSDLHDFSSQQLSGSEF